MSFMKAASAAAFVAVATLATGVTTAEAGKKRHWGHHNHHHKFNKKRFGSSIVIGTANYRCQRWLRRYELTGHKFYLHRYFECIH